MSCIRYVIYKYFLLVFSLSCLFFFFCFLWLDCIGSQARVESQMPAYTTATAIWDLNHICNLEHSSRQPWIHNPLREARDGTHVLMHPVGFVTLWAIMQIQLFIFLMVLMVLWRVIYFNFDKVNLPILSFIDCFYVS